MNSLTLHQVKTIEVKEIRDGTSYKVRYIVITDKDGNEFTVQCFSTDSELKVIS